MYCIRGQVVSRNGVKLLQRNVAHLIRRASGSTAPSCQCGLMPAVSGGSRRGGCVEIAGGDHKFWHRTCDDMSSLLNRTAKVFLRTGRLAGAPAAGQAIGAVLKQQNLRFQYPHLSSEK